jgi:hypothetical protein
MIGGTADKKITKDTFTWLCCYKIEVNVFISLVIIAFASRHPSLVESEHIQNQICNGLDVYNFLPEAFTFKDLFLQVIMPFNVITSQRLPIDNNNC